MPIARVIRLKMCNHVADVQNCWCSSLTREAVGHEILAVHVAPVGEFYASSYLLPALWMLWSYKGPHEWVQLDTETCTQTEAARVSGTAVLAKFIPKTRRVRSPWNLC